MTKYLIDTHAHLDMSIKDVTSEYEKQATDKEVQENIILMKEYGVAKAVIPSVEEKTLNRITEIANKFDNLYSMVGIFPTEAKSYTDENGKYCTNK